MERYVNTHDEVVQKLEAALAEKQITPEQFEEYRLAYLRTLGGLATKNEKGDNIVEPMP